MFICFCSATDSPYSRQTLPTSEQGQVQVQGNRNEDNENEDNNEHEENNENEGEIDESEQSSPNEQEEENMRMHFAQSAMSLGMDNDDLIFNLLYFGDAGASFQTMFNTAIEETVAAHSAENT